MTLGMGQKVLEEIYEGVCSSHIGGGALMVDAIQMGYYWPSLCEDDMNLVRKYEKCQKFTLVQRKPTNPLIPIVRPLPFATLGIDILGPFPKATWQHKYLFVAADYFIKWIKAEAIASITDVEVRKFSWKNIITRFGIPRTMIFHNGQQFDTSKVTDHLNDLGYDVRFTKVAHLQTNGKAAASNKVILNGLQKKLDDAKC